MDILKFQYTLKKENSSISNDKKLEKIKTIKNE